MKGKIVLPGGSGYLGKILTKFFHEKGYDIVILSRKQSVSKYARSVKWNGEDLGSWIEELEGVKAVINLAGLSVNCRYTKTTKQKLLNSRLLSTKILGEAINNCSRKPEIWINSSTATIYEHTYGPPHCESSDRICANVEAKDEFSIQVATYWEDEFNKINPSGVRKILLRTAVVLGREKGTAYAILRRMTKLFLGGKLGHGMQHFCWIHENDFCRSLEFLINNCNSSGIYNITSPVTISNKDMMIQMRSVLRVPFGLPATKLMMEIGAFFLRTEAELMLKSRKVFPERLLSEGFKFQYNNFKDAVSAIENNI